MAGTERELDSGWIALSSVEPARAPRKFGSQVEELFPLLVDLDRANEVWFLDKKVLRRALEAILPPDHGVLEVARDALGARRAERAARAHERLLEAVDRVPPLPTGDDERRLVVWARPTWKPRKVSVEGFRFARRIRQAELAQTVCAFWSGLYFDEHLSDLPPRVSRLEMTIGVIAPRAELPEPLERLLFPERRRPTSLHPAFASAFPNSEPGARLAALEESLVVREQRALEDALGPWTKGRAPSVVHEGGGLGGIRPELVRDVSRRAETELGRAVVLDLLGPPVLRPDRPLLAEKNPLAWARMVKELLRELRSFADLGRIVKAEKSELSARREWMKEIDLGVLPDDGLRRTLEELGVALDRASRLAAETALAAQFAGRVVHALTSVSLEAVDLGLELPATKALESFEQTMAIVRADPEFDSDREARDPLPRSTGERALADFVEDHAEYFPLTELGVPDRLWKIARLAFRRPVDVAERRREARQRADRIWKEAEGRAHRLLVSWLDLLRTEAATLVSFREEARHSEVQIERMIERVLADVDRRLVRLEIGIPRGSAYHATWDELIQAIDLRGTGLRARTSWRRAALARSGSPDSATFRGLARRRELDRVFEGPFVEGPFHYAGRASDSLPTALRAIGGVVVYGSREGSPS